jgi:hypothetical protein
MGLLRALLLLLVLGAAAPAARAQELMSEADVLSLAANLIGPDPWSQPHREEALNAIRDLIAVAGVDFRYTLDFDNRMGAQNTSDHRIWDAMAVNYGPPPAFEAYHRTFLIGTFKLDRVQGETGADGVVTYYSADTRERLGVLQILPDGTYVWDVEGGRHGEVITGFWHEATATEKFPYEGGPSIVLLRAQGGYDYTARFRRQADFEGWLELGEGKARSPRLLGAPL